MSSSAAVGSVIGGRLRRGEVISNNVLRKKTYVNGTNRNAHRRSTRPCAGHNGQTSGVANESKNTLGRTDGEYRSIIPAWAENGPRRPGCDWQARSAAIAKSPSPHRTFPANIFAPACAASRTPRRRVYMSFMHREGWHCQFLEEDLKTSLPCKVTLDTPTKLIEMAKRGGSNLNLETRQALDHGIEIGRGGVWLELTEEQYARLRKR